MKYKVVRKRVPVGGDVEVPDQASHVSIFESPPDPFRVHTDMVDVVWLEPATRETQ